MSAVDSNNAVDLLQSGEALRLQEEACNVLKEKIKAAKKRASQGINKDSQSKVDDANWSDLERERERTRLAESEVTILRRQLNRERETFEKAFGILKSQALSDTSRPEDLLAKCSALEALCAKKDEELACREQEIGELQAKLRSERERHCRELLEIRLKAQQDAYIASHLSHPRDRQRRKAKK